MRNDIHDMSIQVHQIQFCWNPKDPSSSAIPIRKNAANRLPNPEWSHDRTSPFGNAPVAYAINPTRGHKIFIKVSFKTKDTSLFGKEVEARAIQPPIGYPYNPYLSPYLNYVQVVLTTQVNVLGEVKARTVKFNNKGESAFESFELINHRLAERGIGINQVKWHWQFRSSIGRPWVDIDRSEHKVYSLLELPNGPWSGPSGDDFSLPWTEVLDQACTWAKGARTLSQAAGRVTNAVFNLGPVLLEYNCATFFPGYVLPVNLQGDAFFNCTAFLEHLQTGRGTRYVICTDCAAIVTTFSNILGCNLWQSKMYTKGVTFFKVNPVLAIGNFQWDLPCGTPGFAYHEVAWNNECTADDEIFDACLALDRDLSPSFYPHIPLLPANLKFGEAGDGLYRDRLPQPSDVVFCNAQPGDRVRRPLSPNQLVTIRSRSLVERFGEDRARMLKKETGFSLWADRNKLKENLFVFMHKTPEYLLEEWDLSYSFSADWAPGMPRMSQELWRHKSKIKSQAIQISKYECASRKDAHELIIRLLTEAHIPVDYEAVEDVGDAAYATSTYHAVVFARGNLVLVLANADRDQLNLKKLAVDIDQSLFSKNEITTRGVKAFSNQPIPIDLDKRRTTKKAGKIQIVLKDREASKGKTRSRGIANIQEVKSDLKDLRFFSKNCEIIIEDQKLVLIPKSKNESQTTVQVYGKVDQEEFQTELS